MLLVCVADTIEEVGFWILWFNEAQHYNLTIYFIGVDGDLPIKC